MQNLVALLRVRCQRYGNAGRCVRPWGATVNAGKGAAHAAMIVGCAALLAACATVPKIRTDGTDTVPDQANLVVHIKCELTQGLFRIEERYDVARADAADFNKKHPDTPVPEPL